MDYMVLVNKDHPLPSGWEEGLDVVKTVNSVGDEIEAERKTYAAYLRLKKDLEENDDIRTELDSGRRSVAKQQEIMDRYTAEYGAEYASKIVAPPGFSEHHTGLAIDLYYRLRNEDGSFRDIYYNEEMERYPEIWDKIHAKLADYGFILRYPRGKEQITGYTYEPWHIRYLDNPAAAREIMSRPGMTLEEWLCTEKPMPAPFGTASPLSPYFATPCGERLTALPEALMKTAEDGYSWEYEYGADRHDGGLTLMDFPNIYSFIHTHRTDPAVVREILSDASRMVHRRAFTEEEIGLLLGDDRAAAMAHFASPGTIVTGEKGYSEKWIYDHPAEDWRAEGITPEAVATVQPHYFNPLFTQEAAEAFSRKLYEYTGVLTPVKQRQWRAGDVKPDGSVEEGSEAQDEAALDVMEFCQYPDYPTGCEGVSLYMLLKYYGADVTIEDIYDRIPTGPQPYEDENGVRRGANPEREFVGDPRSEYSYGVFNEPVAQAAEQFLSGVRTEKGASLSDVKAILKTGNPVLAWYVSAPMREIMYRWSWTDERGETVCWPGGEHAVVVCGCDSTSVTYRDPNAGTTVIIDDSTFEKGFRELGGRIVYYTIHR